MMPELVIQTEDDLQKLSEWTIKKAWFDKPSKTLRFTLKHLAAANPIVLIIRANVNFKIDGLSIHVDPGINIGAEDTSLP